MVLNTLSFLLMAIGLWKVAWDLCHLREALRQDHHRLLMLWHALRDRLPKEWEVRE
jgi:hypothetical protein